MIAFLKSHPQAARWSALIALIMLYPLCWSYTDSARGRLRAHFDLWRGHYTLLVYGLPPVWRPEYAKLLQERYGIKVRAVASCTVTEDLVSYANAYDEISTAAVNRKFGGDVFKECAEAALKNRVR